MNSKSFIPTRLYIKRHTKTGKRYFGKSTKENLDWYLGSGDLWRPHIDQHGPQYVVNDWISGWFYNEQEIVSFALSFSEIFDIVRSPEWANKIPENGLDGASPTQVRVKDKSGKHYRVEKTDPRYLSGELVSVSKGMIQARTPGGTYIKVAVDDPRLQTGELAVFAKGMVSVKDAAGNTRHIAKDDPAYHLYAPVNKGMSPAVDSLGNAIRVSVDDPRWATGEIRHHRRGTTVNQPRSTCGVCGATMSNANFSKWGHGDECRRKP